MERYGPFPHGASRLKRGYRIWPMTDLANASDHPERLRFLRIEISGLEDVESELSDDGEVFGSVIFPGPGAVLLEGGVEDPKETVFNGPMATDCLCEGGCGEVGGGEIIAGGDGGLSVPFHSRHDAPQGGMDLPWKSGEPSP